MRSLRTRLSLSFGAGALGLIVNLFPIYVFTGAHFYFGGALDVFAGIVLGPQYGLLAAAIAKNSAKPSIQACSALLIVPPNASRAVHPSWLDGMGAKLPN